MLPYRQAPKLVTLSIARSLRTDAANSARGPHFTIRVSKERLFS